MANTRTHVCYLGKSGHETDLPSLLRLTRSRHKARIATTRETAADLDFEEVARNTKTQGPAGRVGGAYFKAQQRDLTPVLHRPVEPATQSGHAGVQDLERRIDDSLSADIDGYELGC